MRLPLVFAALTLLLSSCDPAPASAPDATPFFDLGTYMDGEIGRLTEQRRPVTKTITLNGETETKTLDAINFANDLKLFRDANINKPDWSDKYVTAEKTLSAGHRVTTYVASDSSLIVRRLLVEEDQGVPVRIEVDRRTGNVLSQGRSRMVYEPARGYRVETEQEKRFGDDLTTTIDVRFQ